MGAIERRVDSGEWATETGERTDGSYAERIEEPVRWAGVLTVN
jgi:hypothetical protein